MNDTADWFAFALGLVAGVMVTAALWLVSLLRSGRA